MALICARYPSPSPTATAPVLVSWKVSTMFFAFANVKATRVIDLLRALIYPSEPQVKSTPPTSTQPKHLLGGLWSMIYPSQPLQGKASTEITPAVETVAKKPASLFALIIGIDKYKDATLNDLGGAVADAKAVKSYLETSLGVPGSQIKTLYDTEATRDAIVDGIRALKKNPSIQNGDPILIFYAGHGGTGKAPAGWDAGGPEIQVLLSHDALCKDKDRDIYGVPDRTMGILLDQLANEKGDNITVIFDCCHSGSLTRNERSHLVRGVNLAIDIPADVDKDIWGGTRGTAIEPKFLKSGLSSHVLLAACGAQETAKEDSSRGVFTKALLNTLDSVGADKLTYTGLIRRLPSLLQQNPQCEGHNQNRILFDSKAPSQHRQLYVVRKDDDGDYILEAGAAHGITKGATFDVYRNRDSIASEAPLGTLTASDPPDPFSTILSGSRFNIGEQACALQTGAGAEEDLLVHVAMDPKLESVFRALAEEIKGNKSGQQQIRAVDEDQIGIAHLDIALENEKVVFNILNPLVTKYGLKRMPFQLNPTIGDVRPVLRAAAHFYWHLHRTGRDRGLQEQVKIEFTRLTDDRQPHDENLIHEGVVDLVVNRKNIYGMKITNTSDDDLYASVFYFDNSDLSITSYFQPPVSGGKVDPPLLRHHSLSIGYGAGGGRPCKYSLPAGQDIDVGFVKIFISSEQVDLSAIPQASPFRKRRGVDESEEKPVGRWSTVLITIVQRRSGPS